jgi:acylphosphatase
MGRGGKPGRPAGGPGDGKAPVRAHAVVSGLVQGVCYRAEARSAAERLGVDGWVRNLPGGRVELVVEGTREAVDRLIEWCRHGPPYARIDDVRVEWEPFTGNFTRFGISR